MLQIRYGLLKKEAEEYWQWAKKIKIPPIPYRLAKEGAGSEFRTPLMHYGTVAPVYLSIMRYLKKIPKRKNIKLIELGCGTGRFLSFLKNNFPEINIYGDDYSSEAISYANKNYGKFGVIFRESKAEKTGLKEESFDIVISSHVIEHLPKEDGKKFLSEIYRILKPSGYAFIGTPERTSCQDLYHKNPKDLSQFRLIPPHQHEYYLLELKELAQSVFNKDKIKIDKLINPVFHKIYFHSIKKIKPGKELKQRFKNFFYLIIRDKLPRPWFDQITKIGAVLTMRKLKYSYYNVLMANKIVKEKSRMIADNLLLICQK